MSAALQPAAMTVPEFVDWAASRDGRWELIDGVPEMMAPAARIHAAMLLEIGALLREHLKATGRRCIVMAEPGVVPRVNARTNFRIPDLAVICPEPGTPDPLEEPPTLIVEILSPSNARRTWANVWAYTTVPTLREIVVVRTHEVGAEVLRRGRDGAWPEVPTLLRQGAITLDSIGYSGDLEAFYPAI